MAPPRLPQPDPVGESATLAKKFSSFSQPEARALRREAVANHETVSSVGSTSGIAAVTVNHLLLCLLRVCLGHVPEKHQNGIATFTRKLAPSVPRAAIICTVHLQYSGKVSPLHANPVGVLALAMAAADVALAQSDRDT